MRQLAEIDRVLLPDRLVEVIGGLDVVLDLGRQAALAVERSARRDAHHEEGQGDDDEQRGNCAQQAPDGIGEHVGGMIRCFDGSQTR